MSHRVRHGCHFHILVQITSVLPATDVHDARHSQILRTVSKLSKSTTVSHHQVGYTTVAEPLVSGRKQGIDEYTPRLLLLQIADSLNRESRLLLQMFYPMSHPHHFPTTSRHL